MLPPDRGLLDQQHYHSRAVLAFRRPHVDPVPFSVTRHDPASSSTEIVVHVDHVEMLVLFTPVGLLFLLALEFLDALGILRQPPADVPSEEESETRDEPPRGRRGYDGAPATGGKVRYLA